MWTARLRHFVGRPRKNIPHVSALADERSRYDRYDRPHSRGVQKLSTKLCWPRELQNGWGQVEIAFRYERQPRNIRSVVGCSDRRDVCSYCYCFLANETRRVVAATASSYCLAVASNRSWPEALRLKRCFTVLLQRGGSIWRAGRMKWHDWKDRDFY